MFSFFGTFTLIIVSCSSNILFTKIFIELGNKDFVEI